MRIKTSQLIAVLQDLIRTAGNDPELPTLNAILLHTTRGHHGAEPGQVELFAGVSTNRYCVGHTYTWCSGQLSGPSLWSVRDAKNVVSVFKAARGKDKHDVHAVEIVRSAGEIVIREDPNLIDEGVSLAFGERDAGDFPARGVYRHLDIEQPTTKLEVDAGVSRFVDATPATDISPSVLAPFLAVANRRGEPVRLYRTHQWVPILVQMGEAYRGVLMTVRTDDPVEHQERPTSDLYPPDLDDPRWAPKGDATTETEDWQQLDLGVEGDDDSADDSADELEDGPE
ncbi:hypothetical protein Psed_5753 [Pseudonocardia dioxanivorans CB1190]|uniref:Uncharacterized protein n=1 Tax=Pseudonocardia dioxanivorans (strain ATCC 55486 / DSM 44775 / JCM 13855 / CB1190) TaxID=675635 RepID=F4D192_PSEUX|nr:hypothetical protein [Pseudonocardia dioxanivorans]AEA27880.1 hypothetical protein Psed_5753 [Pseudonocardia dioxanivorans CB1190]